MLKTVALVDDEEVFHWITKQFLEKVNQEVQVLSFYNGREALEYLNKGNNLPDIFMVDLNMPIANGWVFLDEYPESHPKKVVPIYVVSSSIDPADQKKANEYDHVVDFVSKPLSIEFLEKVLS